MIVKLSKAHGSYTIVANVVFFTIGIILSNKNLAYLSGLCNQLRKIDEIKEQNPTEKRITYLKGKKFNYTVLYHDKKYQPMNLCQSNIFICM